MTSSERDAASQLIARLISKHVDRDWGMTNKLVDALGRRLAPKTYKGLLTADELRDWTVPQPPFSIIVNTIRHFVAIVVTTEYILYFDSYGLACFLPPVCRFLNKLKRSLKLPLLHNRSKLQSVTSQHCGLFALSLVAHHEDLDSAEPLPFVNRACALNDRRSVSYLIKALERRK